ncbi:aminotransferase class I/II-fold pyridoxal phosphate-dependent enzyme [Roseitranquillus sediminis]|uniref:aminotransferase class I/II-fold pyridoxal phosphate-dependent enzyme n=1 Tax=Roseitranquillus sediminis TaxID=2809051 RepID=UPI001D0C90F1|nr:aminotransferase class I/II-fold pyridoxal phosphate-dependent enzyme [Roseitranquillus sediminis]MBM9594572.1 aminotransferase class I/II-fold pyridoxal phosphate-dependent enzyme [Roseitranquillus sediminis]
MGTSEEFSVPQRALEGSMRDFRVQKGPDLIGRCEAFYEWQDVRRQCGTWPFSRSTEKGPSASCAVRDDRGILAEGVNFASQDYLSLSSHPAVAAAAKAAIDDMGVHSAGSPALVGNTSTSIGLDQQLADFVQMREAILYPTGWAAGFGVIKGLVRDHDYILIDALAHACLQVGAAAATRNVVPFRHLNVDDARKKITAIRSANPDAGILIVTEGLFSMDSDVPDISAFQTLARQYGALLVVDVAHDLGNLGPGGTGHIGAQGMLGQVDLIMGSFSKTFGSNGGFVATDNRAVKEYLRFYSPSCTFSNALSPAQVATIAKALEIVRSEEGQVLREKLMSNVLSLREQIRNRGMEFYGDPSAIVAVKTGAEALARLTARELPALGLLANLVEFPAVAKGQARFRLQVMAGHTADEIEAAAASMEAGMKLAALQLEERVSPVFLAKAS